jgi:hypothetical protein
MDISRSKSDWQQIAEISNCTPRRLPIRFALSLRTFHSNRSQEWSESQYKMSRSSERMPSQFEFVPAISRVFRIVLTSKISVFALLVVHPCIAVLAMHIEGCRAVQIRHHKGMRCLPYCGTAEGWRSVLPIRCDLVGIVILCRLSRSGFFALL